MPPPQAEEMLIAVHIDQKVTQTTRDISHGRLNTGSPPLINLQNTPSPKTPLAGSKDVFISDEDEAKKPIQGNSPTCSKGLGEPLKPAIRLLLPNWPPSNMPSTPTFSKAVQFDLHLEHVRYFLQADKPLAVSAGSSPVEVYNSGSRLLFDRINSGPCSHPFEWELVMSNFTVETPVRLLLPVRVERVSLLSDNSTLVGNVAVANLVFNKYVAARFTFDNWEMTSEVVAEGKDDALLCRYLVNGLEYWDNNSANFQVNFRKKLKQQNRNGKKGTQRASGNPTQMFSNSNGPYTTKTASKSIADTTDVLFSLTMGNRSLSDAKASYKAAPSVVSSIIRADPLQQDTIANPFLASQSYNELLEKYCFFGFTKSPQMSNYKTLRSY
ncbi:hypothetical protein B0O99DRAFT_683801 [Bisporella sp. PMI_857]|nr:hypothetical protein B0O99DRAFT_683801 [Bisporella sp. PMI_857]